MGFRNESRQVFIDKIVEFLKCFWNCSAKPYKGTFTTICFHAAYVCGGGGKGENFADYACGERITLMASLLYVPFLLLSSPMGESLSGLRLVILSPSPTRGRSAIFKLPFSPPLLHRQKGGRPFFLLQRRGPFFLLPPFLEGDRKRLSPSYILLPYLRMSLGRKIPLFLSPLFFFPEEGEKFFFPPPFQFSPPLPDLEAKYCRVCIKGRGKASIQKSPSSSIPSLFLKAEGQRWESNCSLHIFSPLPFPHSDKQALHEGRRGTDRPQKQVEKCSSVFRPLSLPPSKPQS